MKKAILIYTVCLFAVAGNVSAQAGTNQGTGKVSLQDFHFITGFKEGVNKMVTKDGRGTLQFVKKADTFSEIEYKDAAGNATRLTPAQGVVKGASKPVCTSRSADMFFNNAGKDIGMIVCKSDQAAGGYFITLDLPDGATGKAQNRRVEVKLSK